MKKAISLALVIMLCLSLCACGDPASKLEKQVTEDLFNELNSVYFVEDIEVTVRETEEDGEYYYISGKVVMEAWNAIDYKFVTLKTEFDGKYLVRDNTLTKVSLDIDDDWSFVSERR